MIWPRSGVRKPVMRLNRVVLPAPLGPMTALTMPRGTAKLTSCRAARPPKDRVTLCRVRSRSRDRKGPSFFFVAAELPEIENAPHQAPGQENDHHHEDGAEDEYFIIVEDGEQFRQNGEDGSPQERPPDAGHASHYHHGDELDGKHEIEGGGLNEFQ